ncbi:hypothetical protein F4804DRAFT_220795 [Jackrogersella minutella]|nr:hypothetical protein F4804DRAFT_220795 [Jackrogersella minutella]
MGSTPNSTQSPAASPAKGKAASIKKSSGKGVTKRASRKIAAKKSARGKGRGQKKIYSDPLTQASYERQKELRDLYSQVALAVKPALDELADQSIKDLTEDLDGHKNADEYFLVQQQLDDRLKQVLEYTDREYRTRVDLAKFEFQQETNRVQKAFMNSFDYCTEELLDGALNRASILDELRTEGCPLTIPDLTYSYVEHIPYVSCTGKSDRATPEQTRKAKSSAKRKAEGQPDEQHDSKKPRHTGGLLASEQQPDGVPESNAPSPTPLEEQEVGPASNKDLPDLPNGTSEPDEYGVRSVSRRAKSPANRFIVPPLFEWGDNEIGFRDSTNDSTRKATRATRGRFIDTPNSSNWHWDHTVRDYDCREYKHDTLDQEIVKKHGLHPTYGIFLPGSTNEPEQPGERVDGTRPVVVIPDETTTTHASRSVRPMKMDRMLQEDATKGFMAKMLGHFCEEQDIDEEDIISYEMRERERQALERLATSSDEDETPVEELDHFHSTDASGFGQENRIGLLLQAASDLDKRTPRSSSPRQSRPYDAVRDVFTSKPAPARVERHPEADTHALDILAHLADDISRREPETPPHPVVEQPDFNPRLYQQPPQQRNAFLQTALNPNSNFTPIAPAPSTMEIPQQTGPPRIPFASKSSAKGSPVLPPLRPNRPDGLGKLSNIPQQQPLPPAAQQPQEFGSHSMMHTNSGIYYPPPPTRPYHQPLSYHDPQMMHAQGSSVMPNQSQLPPHNYRPVLSPPLHCPQPIAPMPQLEPPAPSVSPPGPPMIAPSSPAHATRQRNSVSSNGNNAGKYRKIAAAPIAHNRPWPSNGGTELRLAHYDHKEAIKDYRANEPPPRTGPTTIRGWNVNNVSKGRNRNLRKEDSEEKDSPK